MNEMICKGTLQHSHLYSSSQLDSMWEPVRHAIEQKLIPGASAAVFWKGHILQYAAGLAFDAPGEVLPVRFDTLYDCASVTKVTVTLPLVLMLAGSGACRLDDPVSRYIPEFNVEGKKNISIRHLLSHTSGLPAERDYFSRPWTWDEILKDISHSPLVFPPGTNRLYSDLGFILLGHLLANLSGLPLDVMASDMLFKPAGMWDSQFNPPAAQRFRIAATEYSQQNQTFWHGTVHDENARQMGGVSGHAGLFSTSSDLLKYARLWLSDNHNILPAELVHEAIHTQTPPMKDVNRGLGWILKHDIHDVSGAQLSAKAFGHTGFTGTSIYCDPEQDFAAVLLTNRVHYGRERQIGSFRIAFHEHVAQILKNSNSSLT